MARMRMIRQMETTLDNVDNIQSTFNRLCRRYDPDQSCFSWEKTGSVFRRRAKITVEYTGQESDIKAMDHEFRVIVFGSDFEKFALLVSKL